MKKKIAILILLILGIISIILGILFKKNSKMTYSYDDMVFTYLSNIKENDIYKNTMYIENKSNNTKLNNIKLIFYLKNEVLEEIEIKTIDISSKKNKLEFDSKNKLSNSTSFKVLPNSLFDISSTYNDGTILINDFLETDSEYIFNLKNLTNKRIEKYNMTIDYMDENKNVIYTKQYEFSLNSNEIMSFSTLKGNILPNKIKYIRINKN